jgi:hypothetical protein
MKGNEEWEDWKRARNVKPIKKSPIKFRRSPVKIKTPSDMSGRQWLSSP